MTIKWNLLLSENSFFPQITEFNNDFSIESRLYIFTKEKNSVFTYDTHENEWCRKYLPSKMVSYTCVQKPCF